MLKYPISTILWLSKQSIKDKIQDALKLHNNIDMRLTAIVKDKDGKIIKVHKQKSHSFVANFMYMLATFFFNTDYTWKDINGTSNTYSFTNEAAGAYVSGSLWRINSILIGTGTATPTPNDYALGNQIANGTGNGQMVYNSISFVAPSVNGNTTSATIEQTFQNQSGNPITVTEVGIKTETLGSSYWDYLLIVHDLLSSPITVPNNAVLTIIYTISVTT